MNKGVREIMGWKTIRMRERRDRDKGKKKMRLKQKREPWKIISIIYGSKKKPIVSHLEVLIKRVFCQ